EGSGSHTLVVPPGTRTSTRVVTSNVRHETAWRGLNADCANAGGRAAPAGSSAPAFRNERLSMIHSPVGNPHAATRLHREAAVFALCLRWRAPTSRSRRPR